MKIFALPVLLFLLLCSRTAHAQQIEENNGLIQFSGLVVTEENNQMVPMPFTNIYIKKKNRGTYSNYEGFFSLIVEKGDVVTFSAVGFKHKDFVVPDTLRDNRYSIVQIMTQDTILLAETVIFPWPSREHFRLEFLNMDVHDELQKRAMTNLAQETLARVADATPKDGLENTNFYMRQQAKSYYYYGQIPPMNIFNPLAWKDFFEAWKAGKFKKKK